MATRSILAALLACSAAFGVEVSHELHPPSQVFVAGEPLDVERSGHAAPFFGDVEGDGRRDLLVGQYEEGKLRIYRKLGTDNKPVFDGDDFLRIGCKDATDPYG